jgi:hypothetical protein
MSIRQLQELLDLGPVPQGWIAVTADEWADFTSEYRTTASERLIDGRDAMACWVMKDGEKVDLSYVLYAYHRDGALKRYFISPENALRHNIHRISEQFRPKRFPYQSKRGAIQ